MLLVVATSSGSSPGRAGYKMAVAADGELCGSIGGGVMEVRLVERSLSQIRNLKFAIVSEFVEQVHQKNAPDASGMICSGKQTVIFRHLTSADSDTINSIVECLHQQKRVAFQISNLKFQIVENTGDTSRFSKTSEAEFVYTENLGPVNDLYIIGGGHCSLALSSIASKLDFRIVILDDRPELNTIAKNQFANDIKIIRSYDDIADHVSPGPNVYVVVMTLGYASDEIVIRSLFDRDFKYFGALGSKAKMKTLLQTLKNEGFDPDRLARIRTPIGFPINSHTPEEIAVSIAAEIIAIKNS